MSVARKPKRSRTNRNTTQLLNLFNLGDPAEPSLAYLHNTSAYLPTLPVLFILIYARFFIAKEARRQRNVKTGRFVYSYQKSRLNRFAI